MARRIKFFDTTLRDGEQTPGVSLNLQEKLEIALALERLGVDYVEAGFAIASNGDFEAIQGISEALKSTSVVSLARALEKDIDRAWDAVKSAVSPRIHIFLATSDIHMKYKLKMTEQEVLENSAKAVAYAKKFTGDVEFSPEDATRSRPEFLYRVLAGAIQAGATCLNIPDTVGYTNPEEYTRLIKGILANVPGIEKVEISVHCHNDLGLAAANSAAAAAAGASQIEGCINGLGERGGNAAIEELVMLFNTRRDYYQLDHNIDSTKINRTSKLISSLTGIYVQPHKPIVGANAFAHESGIHQHGVLEERTTYEIMTPESIGLTSNRMVLGKLSGKHAFVRRLEELGVVLDTDDAVNKAFGKFKALADRKKDVLDEDLLALADDNYDTKAKRFALVSFQISSGNRMINTATVRLKVGDDLVTNAATGDGPIDASYKAINEICGYGFTLKDYALRSVTGGHDALGEVNVKIECNGKVYLGRGVSTDIIESSILACLNAVNRVV
ncbi:MAG: 2-isopropylmalate synthase [Clostridiales bacterium]|jgi:2-isopropylmalate synthase|nr:2-isopropylmalate synthase [Clostridiales bacterium]